MINNSNCEEKEMSFLSSLEIVDDSRVEEWEKQQAEQKEKDRLAELEKHYKTTSGVPSKYFNESLESYKATKENQKTFEWICGFVDAVEQGKNTKNLVYLFGNHGIGKTHLGCGAIRRLGGLIITSLELCITYDSCRDFNAPKTRIQFLKEICSQKLLVIDEIGKGIQSIEKQILPFIVNEYYGNGNILLFLGNISRQDFNEIISEAGEDRFCEAGVYISLTGDSNRKKSVDNIKNKC